MPGRRLTLGERMMRHPQGIAGRFGGMSMLLWNRDQERRVISRARLCPGDRVVVVGPGPGLGVKMAAEAVAPTGRVIAVEPSPVMRDMTARRCAPDLGLVEVRDGTAERTGCGDASVDVVTAVNSVGMWDRDAGFAELARILRPGGRLLIAAHRHCLGVSPAQLADAARSLNDAVVAAGFRDVVLTVHRHRLSDKSVELIAYR